MIPESTPDFSHFPMASTPDRPERKTEVVQRSSGPRTSDDIRRQLEDAERRIQRHVTELRSELTLRDVTVADSPVLDYVRWHPFAAVGLVAGIAALAAFAVSLARRSPAEIDEQEQWTRALIDDLLDDAAARVGPGRDGEEALRRALRRRSPVIFIETTRRRKEDDDSGSLLRSLGKTALGFAGKAALNFITQEFASKQKERSDFASAARS